MKSRIRLQLVGLRVAYGLGSRVAPTRAARAAANLWFTAPRPVRSDGALDISAEGRQFRLLTSTGEINGTTWGVGPPVYFMHGWGGQAAQVAPLVDPLVDAGFRVITFDAPGHGRAYRAGAIVRTHAIQFGQALAAVVAEHGPAYAVVAHSLGAIAVGCELVPDGELDAERLVLVAPLVDVAGPLERFSALLGLGRRARLALHGQVERHTGRDVTGFELASMAGLSDLRSVLVIHDRDDRQCSLDAVTDLVGRWPGARLVITHGLGHHRILWDDDVVRTVIDGLAAVSDRRVSRER